MTRLLAPIALCATLALAAPAGAHPRASLAASGRALLGASAKVAEATVRHQATAAEQTVALQIAYAYWQGHAPADYATAQGAPLCGPAVISWQALTGDTSDVGAEAFMDGSCQVVFNPQAWAWRTVPRRVHVASGGDEWQMFCTVTVHEVGHLILGPDFFAASNPDDPAHSATPGDVMYSQLTGLEVPACQRPDPSR